MYMLNFHSNRMTDLINLINESKVEKDERNNNLLKLAILKADEDVINQMGMRTESIITTKASIEIELSTNQHTITIRKENTYI